MPGKRRPLTSITSWSAAPDGDVTTPTRARQARQRALARRVEQALGLEPRAQLLEGELERALPARLELAHEELEVAARLVDA